MRRALEAVALTAGLFVLWLVFISTVTAAEVIAGLVCAVLAAAVHLAGRRVLGVDATQAAPWGVRWLPAIVVAAVTDTARVVALLARMLATRRPIRGDYRWIGVGGGDETRLGGATLAVTITPGSVVVHTDPESGRMLVHSITPPSLLERTVES